MQRIWLFFLLALAPAVASQDSDLAGRVGRCLEKHSPYSPSRGTHDPDRSTPEEDFFLLARGEKTWIWRVVPKDSEIPSYILKEYQNESKYLKEKAAFEATETLLEGSNDSFELVRYVDLGPERRALRLTDVRGKSLYRVLKDERVSAGVREALEREYDRRYEAFKAKLNVLPKGEAEFFGTGRLSVLFELPGGVTLTLSPDQVVVVFDPHDPNQFKLFLVDPY